MEINRNQVFVAGLVLVFLGIELRLMESFVLSPKATKILAEQTGHPAVAATNTLDALVGTQTQLPPKAFRPPEWIGWLLLSVGAVLILHSMTMPKPA